jgi:predicted dehydrogenase
VNGWRAYGPANSIVVDNVNHLLVRLKKRGYKSYLNYFFQPLHLAAEHARNTRRNIGRFLRADFHDDSGLKNCIEAFYNAIANKGEPPATPREILLVAVIMDRIFEQLRAQQGGTTPAHAAHFTA